MPSPTSTDRSAAQPPERGTVDALISQTHRLRGGVDAVRRDTVSDEEDPGLRWRRALCDLAVHHLDDLGQQLGQLREGLPPEEPRTEDGPAATAIPLPAAPPENRRTSLLSRVGSAEWNLLADEVDWSEELFRIFGRAPDEGALSLDELPSFVLPKDHTQLTSMVTDCLVEGKPIDGEFRIVRADGAERTVHMTGEPVLDADGCTASMWAVLRDVSELRRSQRALHETRDSLQRERHAAQTERRLAVELQEAVLPPWRGSLRFPETGPATLDVPAATLDVAAHYLPCATGALIGGDWYDAMPLPDGRALLSVGDLTGHGVTATSGMAMLLGALRGMAVAGVTPGPLMGCLNHLLDTASQPALGSAVCCQYDPRTGSLTWSQAGHPAPLLFRNGTGRALSAPEGMLLGAASGAQFGQAEEQLLPGDLLVLHTDGLAQRRTADPSGPPQDSTGAQRVLDLAPRLSAARSAQECVRIVVEECGGTEREDDACVLVARVGS
ncbi:PP2C family protein-serine/threonine phosphatase [Streptomyces sp. NPDC048639]|uniref:PP2C family protein-serine/threonine phosphatase n=1 Tax=Streptomyces sp. NPDC048639 TaxID=3365581 RepID=UPI003719914D